MYNLFFFISQNFSQQAAMDAKFEQMYHINDCKNRNVSTYTREVWIKKADKVVFSLKIFILSFYLNKTKKKLNLKPEFSH